MHVPKTHLNLLADWNQGLQLVPKFQPQLSFHYVWIVTDRFRHKINSLAYPPPPPQSHLESWARKRIKSRFVLWQFLNSQYQPTS